jgi:hypothetical protein
MKGAKSNSFTGRWGSMHPSFEKGFFFEEDLNG